MSNKLTIASILFYVDGNEVKRVDVKYIKTEPDRDQRLQSYIHGFIANVTPKLTTLKGGIANG